MTKKFLILLVGAAVMLCSCGAGPAEEEPKAEEGNRSLVTAEAAGNTDSAQIPMQSDEAEKAVEGYAFDRQQPEERIIGGVNYFSFRQNSVTHTDENGKDLMIEVLTQPFFYSADPQTNDWVNGVIDELHLSNVQFGQDLLQYAGDDLKELGADNFYSYSHYVSMEIGRHDDTVVSLLSLSSVYSGGAHPNVIQTAYNMDLSGLKVLTLEDVVFEEQVPELIRLVQSGVEEKFGTLGENVLFEDYAQTIANMLTYGNMTPYWYFDPEGLVLFFNQYELAPYAAGIIKVPLRYDQLNGILRPEYVPEPYQGRVSNVLLSQEPEEGDWVYYVDFAEGETIHISVEGTAHHVQLSEVNFAAQTMVGKSIMFSSNRLDDQATIAVTGELSDESRIYEVEYYDEQGGPNAVYVQGLEILDQLPTEE